MLQPKTPKQSTRTLTLGEEQKVFRIRVTGHAVSTPLVVTQPRSQLIHMNQTAMAGNVIFIPQYSRSGRILINNISSSPLKFDLKLLRPDEMLSEDMVENRMQALGQVNQRSRTVIAAPLSAVVEAGCQCAVSVAWDEAVPENTMLSAYLFAEYREGGSRDKIRVLAWKGAIRCVSE